LNRSNGTYRRGALIEVAVNVLVIYQSGALAAKKATRTVSIGHLQGDHSLAVATWRRANGEHLSGAISSRHWQYPVSRSLARFERSKPSASAC
jgi:hypothetical protein